MIILKSRNGMTLIELIITIAILSIIVAISYPRIDWLSTYKEKKELITFRNDIVYARNSAILKRTSYRLDMRPNKNYYLIYEYDNGWKRVKKQKLESGLRFRDNYLHRSEVTFKPTGAPDKGDKIILLNRKGETIEITITPAVSKVNIYS